MYKNLSGINQPKRVDVFDEDGIYITSFPSLRTCSKEMNIPTTTLHKAIYNRSVINGKYYKYGKTKKTND